MIRVLLADDQYLFAQSLKIAIQSFSDDIEITAIAGNGKEAVELIATHKPDVVLMDVRMPEMDGVEATARILAENKEMQIVMLTTYDDDAYVKKAIRNGAVGYLLKDISAAQLVSAIRSIHHGSSFFSPGIIKKLLEDQKQDAPRPKTGAEDDEELLDALNRLSRREKDIINLMAEGYDNREIADRINVAEQTVRNKISSIYSRLGVHSRARLIRLVIQSRPRD